MPKEKSITLEKFLSLPSLERFGININRKHLDNALYDGDLALFSRSSDKYSAVCYRHRQWEGETKDTSIVFTMRVGTGRAALEFAIDSRESDEDLTEDMMISLIVPETFTVAKTRAAVAHVVEVLGYIGLKDNLPADLPSRQTVLDEGGKTVQVVLYRRHFEDEKLV